MDQAPAIIHIVIIEQPLHGRLATPFNTLFEGYNFVTKDGNGIVQMEAGISTETFTGAYALNPSGTVLLTAIGGTVQIGPPTYVERLSNVCSNKRTSPFCGSLR